MVLTNAYFYYHITQSCVKSISSDENIVFLNKH